jgi:hypothetical protein
MSAGYSYVSKSAHAEVEAIHKIDMPILSFAQSAFRRLDRSMPPPHLKYLRLLSMFETI